MKYFNNPLICLAAICLVVAIPAAVIHSFVDNSVDNPTQNEQTTPSPTPTVQPTTTPEEDNGDGKGREMPHVVVASTPKPQDVAIEDSCGKSTKEAAAAGWKLLSCDPLRVMPLKEWETKSASANYQYRPELYCFDESNFAGIFKEQMGEMVDGYYPDWLSEMKLDNGCSFFFHPTQGRENAPLDPADARG